MQLLRLVAMSACLRTENSSFAAPFIAVRAITLGNLQDCRGFVRNVEKMTCDLCLLGYRLDLARLHFGLGVADRGLLIA